MAPKLPERSFIGEYINEAFALINRGREYVCTAHSVTPKTLGLKDIQSYFDVYGCDLDKGLFVECIFALDNKFIDSVMQK